MLLTLVSSGIVSETNFQSEDETGNYVPPISIIRNLSWVLSGKSPVIDLFKCFLIEWTLDMTIISKLGMCVCMCI